MLIVILSSLLGVSLAVVLGVLLTGIVAFSRGGEFNRRYANRLMNLRVAAQGAAVLFLGLLILARLAD